MVDVSPWRYFLNILGWDISGACSGQILEIENILYIYIHVGEGFAQRGWLCTEGIALPRGVGFARRGWPG